MYRLKLANRYIPLTMSFYSTECFCPEIWKFFFLSAVLPIQDTSLSLVMLLAGQILSLVLCSSLRIMGLTGCEWNLYMLLTSRYLCIYYTSDIDWEFPSTNAEGSNFATLLSSLRTALNNLATRKGDTVPYLITVSGHSVAFSGIF